MKNATLTVLVLIMSFSAFAQIRKIPAEVTDAFKTRYPHAEKVEWRDKLTDFEASFVLNNVSMKAQFNSKGEWQLSETASTFEELPAEVKDGFQKSKYTDWEIKEVTKMDKNAEAIQYRIFIRKSGIQKKYLYFDKDGRLLREALTL